jgi:hypothetical protein
MYAAQAETPAPPQRTEGATARNRMNVLFTMSNNRQRRIGQATPGGNAKAHHTTRKTSQRTAQKANTPPKQETPQGAGATAAKPEWWSQTGSNRRPHACKARALPAELWPRKRHAGTPGAGTADGGPGRWWAWQMVGLGRLELPTSRLSSARSNQLSYKPGTRPAQNPRSPSRPRRTPPRKPAKASHGTGRRRAVREERETKTTKSRKWKPEGFRVS